jgi:hypothetical protein
MKNIRASIVTLTLTVLCLVMSTPAFAQRNPTMAGQRDDAERDILYTQFAENKKLPIPEKQRLAYYAAKDYLKRFDDGRDEHASEMRKFVSEYEKVLKNFNVYSFYMDKKYLKTFEAGRAVLLKEPQNFFVLTVLAEAGFDNSQAGDNSLNTETLDYTRRAIDLLESDKLATTDPFATKEVARGVLNFILGWYLRPQSPIEAASALTIAAQSASPYKTNALTYNLLGAAILKGDYARISAEYNEKFGNKPPSEEQQAMLTQLMKIGERAIDAYARAVALSTKPAEQEGRAKLMVQLTNLYKSFHNGSDEGLNQLIAEALSKPMP